MADNNQPPLRKSSNEILSELFGAFNAEPPPIIIPTEAETINLSSTSSLLALNISEKDEKLINKKQKKHKKLKKHKTNSLPDSSNLNTNRKIKHKKKRKKHKLKKEKHKNHNVDSKISNSNEDEHEDKKKKTKKPKKDSSEKRVVSSSVVICLTDNEEDKIDLVTIKSPDKDVKTPDIKKFVDSVEKHSVPLMNKTTITSEKLSSQLSKGINMPDDKVISVSIEKSNIDSTTAVGSCKDSSLWKNNSFFDVKNKESELLTSSVENKDKSSLIKGVAKEFVEDCLESGAKQEKPTPGNILNILIKLTFYIVFFL